MVEGQRARRVGKGSKIEEKQKSEDVRIKNITDEGVCV